MSAESPDLPSSPKPRPSVELPPSVLSAIERRTGEAPRVSLREEESGSAGAPLIDPASEERRALPQGRSSYQVLGEIARGGMGVILKGHDVDLGRDVAMKVLAKDLAQRPEVVQRFVEEAQIGGQLQHPGIVPVYELGLMADERPYFTMKLVKGRTLATLFAERATVAADRQRLLTIFESVCQTVAYAHSRGVIHRDLKPANIMVGAFGEVQVVDWGLAKVLARGGTADEKRAKAMQSQLTVLETVRSDGSRSGTDSLVGSVMGTPAYMPPEQASGRVDRLDERSDVFALGAILCEILTGAPPYSGERDKTLLQAAQADLDDALVRLDGCEADRDLIQLAKQCLMAAPAARPRNAGEVAKAVHGYLISVEERAHKAELASAEARIKAAEERRARRLTLALAAAVIAALTLGGGGAWLANRERAKRLEQTRTEVDAAHGDSIRLAQTGKHEEALAAARRALALAQNGEGDAALLERARAFVARAERDASAAESEARLVAQDEQLRSKLIELRLAQFAAIDDRQRELALDGQFAQAFQDYGVDLEGVDVVPALERIRERAIAEDVALALDDWGRLRRRYHGQSSEEAENLFVLAMDLDPDPARMQMREAIAAGDEAALEALAAPENLPRLGPSSVFVLSVALWGNGDDPRRPRVLRLMAQALRLFPGDFALQSAGGTFYFNAGRFLDALTCRAAALSLRPQDLTARVRLGEVQLFLGRLADAEATLRACLASAPNDIQACDLYCLTQVGLGNYASGLAATERVKDQTNDPGLRADWLMARYLTGALSPDELARALDKAVDTNQLLSLLYGLVENPDAARRDPELVLRTLEERASSLGTNRWPQFIEAIARVRLGDFEGAQAALDRGYRRPWIVVLTPMAYDFLRSVVYSGLRRADEARACYERGVVQWNESTADEPELWTRSDAARWKSEAEAALAR
jgi:tetratricopeptide (TPR) repeat protein/tRNA A-37 threonylcarbamoyl transferase component Bud32